MTDELSAPVPPEDCGDDSTRHWKLIALGVVMAIVFIFSLGVGYGQEWGAQQWGPFSDWLVGFLTLGAVVVALRESLKAQHSRLIDHELMRRRENLRALADLWAAVAAMNESVLNWHSFLRGLPEEFDHESPRRGSATAVKPLGREIADYYGTFISKWNETLEPPLFVAMTILEDSPLESLVADFSQMLESYREEVSKILPVAANGRRPRTEPASRVWSDIFQSRKIHLDLARKHFSLGLRDVEAAVRGR